MYEGWFKFRFVYSAVEVHVDTYMYPFKNVKKPGVSFTYST